MSIRFYLSPQWVRRAVAVALIAAIGWWLWRGGLSFLGSGHAIRHAPGILVAEAPAQTLSSSNNTWSQEGYTITSLATIDLRARVLSKRRYRSGREADLSSYDLALGWGPMSDQAILDVVDVSQRDRWYFWEYGQPIPINNQTIITHSGNFHTIAATDDVLTTIESIVPGHVIHLQGQLVRVNAADGWRWVSSLSRGDTGAGSCELVWVESITIDPTHAAE